MKNKTYVSTKCFTFFCFFGLLLISQGIQGAYTVVQGKVMDKRDVPTLSAQEHYGNGIREFQEENWRGAIDQFRKVAACFPDSPFGGDALYYLAVSYYHFGDYEYANKKLTLYLQRPDSAKHFEDVMRHKLAVAKHYAGGARKHLLGTDQLPQWLPAQKDALEIFDEVIAVMGHHEIAAEALYAKGQLLRTQQEFRESVESFQSLIKRFPKYELVPETFLAISQTYAEQAVDEKHNPDILPLAELNIQKFREAFPRDPLIEQAKAHLVSIQEFTAQGLLETAEFYERISKPEASIIYYTTAIRRFPETYVAQVCRKKLEDRGEDLVALGLEKKDSSL